MATEPPDNDWFVAAVAKSIWPPSSPADCVDLNSVALSKPDVLSKVRLAEPAKLPASLN